MKRFYKAVSVEVEGDAHAVRLDGRPVRTPARQTLAVPFAALAEAIAAEWQAQGKTVDPRTMPFTGLANGAIDQIAPDPLAYAAGIARYGQSDLLCYRADGPQELVARQAAAWDPLIDWAQARYDVAFRVTQGILPVDQPPETLERLGTVVAAFDPFTLAGLSTLVTLSGSLICGLAAVEDAYPAELLWAAAELDELWQAEQWGEDAEAAARSARRATEFSMARNFCAMSR